MGEPRPVSTSMTKPTRHGTWSSARQQTPTGDRSVMQPREPVTGSPKPGLGTNPAGPRWGATGEVKLVTPRPPRPPSSRRTASSGPPGERNRGRTGNRSRTSGEPATKPCRLHIRTTRTRGTDGGWTGYCGARTAGMRTRGLLGHWLTPDWGQARYAFMGQG